MAGVDLLTGDDGPNLFWSGDGADLVVGGRGGDDVFFAGGDDDRHWGCDGSDTIDLSNAESAVVSLLGGIARSDATGTDQLGSIENATARRVRTSSPVTRAPTSSTGAVVRTSYVAMAGDDTLEAGRTTRYRTLSTRSWAVLATT